MSVYPRALWQLLLKWCFSIFEVGLHQALEKSEAAESLPAVKYTAVDW